VEIAARSSGKVEVEIKVGTDAREDNKNESS